MFLTNITTKKIVRFGKIDEDNLSNLLYLKNIY